jgi:hypothetical protein
MTKTGIEAIDTKAPFEERIDALVERFKLFSKQTAESILEQSHTVYRVSREFGLDYRTDFCQRVGLSPEGSTHKKLVAIGKQYTRLHAHVDRLPNSWTTIYDLAKMDVDAFNKLIKGDVLSPYVTAKQIGEALHGKKDKPKRRRLVIVLDGAKEALAVSYKFKRLAEEHGLTLENFSSLERALEREKDDLGVISQPAQPIAEATS